jgi:hypothetical protein
LHLHLILHFTLGISTVAVDNDYIEKNQYYHYCDDNTGFDTLIFRKEIGSVGGKSLRTHSGRRGKTSANSVEDCKTLKLSSIGTVIDDQRRIDSSSIGLPIADLIFNNVIYCAITLPV